MSEEDRQCFFDPSISPFMMNQRAKGLLVNQDVSEERIVQMVPILA